MPNPKKLWLVIPAVVLGVLVILAAAAFFGLSYYTTTIVKREIDQRIQDISEYVRVDYDGLSVNWLNFTVNMNKVRLSKPPLPGYITIDKVAVRDFTATGFRFLPTVVTLDNIALNNGGVKFGVERLRTSYSLKRIPTEEEITNDWRVVVNNLSAGQTKVSNLTFTDKDTQMNITEIKTDYAVAGNNHKNFGLNLGKINIHAPDIQLSSKDLSLTGSLDQNNVLNHFSKKLQEFSMNIPAQAKKDPFLARLSALGYERLAIGTDLNYDYQPEAKNLSLVWDTSAADMGRLQFNVQLTDYKSPPVPMDGTLAGLLNYIELLRTPAEKASLKGLTVLYQDFGLAPRLIKSEAQSQGLTPQAFTQNLVDTLNASLTLLPLPPAIKKQADAVSRFLQNPQEIQLAITCKQPVRLKHLQEGSVSGFLDLLTNIEINLTAK
jgi:hypothetical protein